MLRKLNEARNKKAFTLIELLVVVLILAILMAVALPLYLNAVADSQKKTCRANMQTIANAEQAFKVSDTGHAYTTDLTKLRDLGAVPICPNGGTYSVSLNGGTSESGQTVPAGSLIVACSFSGHGVYAPGFDGQ
jgi:type IV pilus assembly protein PilA